MCASAEKMLQVDGNQINIQNHAQFELLNQLCRDILADDLSSYLVSHLISTSKPFTKTFNDYTIYQA